MNVYLSITGTGAVIHTYYILVRYVTVSVYYATCWRNEHLLYLEVDYVFLDRG